MKRMYESGGIWRKNAVKNMTQRTISDLQIEADREAFKFLKMLEDLAKDFDYEIRDISFSRRVTE